MFQHPFVRAVFGLALGFAGVAVTIEAVERFGDRGPEPGEWLGAPDFVEYCADDAGSMEAVNVTGDALGWRCAGFVDGVWLTVSIDVGALCRDQFRDDAAEDLLDRGDPDGWQCVRGR